MRESLGDSQMQQNNDVPTALSRNTDFRLLVGGQLVSQVGNQLQSLALPLVVFTLTGSAVQAGAILAVSTATYLLFGLVAGALVDRWDRKRTMIWSEMGRAVLTASIPVALIWEAVSLPQLYAVAILTGVLEVLFQTANSTTMPHVVAPGQLPAALGINQAASSAVGIAGSALAGAAYAAGPSIPFLVNVISFVVSAASLRAIRPQFQEPHRGAVRGTGDFLGEIREGLVWVWRQPVIRLLTMVEAADGLRYGAGYLLIIELARQVGADAFQIGLVFGGAGVGGLVGGLLGSRHETVPARTSGGPGALGGGRRVPAVCSRSVVGLAGSRRAVRERSRADLLGCDEQLPPHHHSRPYARTNQQRCGDPRHGRDVHRHHRKRSAARTHRRSRTRTRLRRLAPCAGTRDNGEPNNSNRRSRNSPLRRNGEGKRLMP